MSSPFRIAFLGIDNPHGAGWRELFAGLNDELELVAFVPGFSGGTASLEERYAHLPRFELVDDLIAFGDFDGAFIALPNNEAPHAAVRLAEAGKHIMVEKPMAGTADDASPVIDAVAKNNVAFQNGYMWRYDEGANRLRDMVTDGRFGRLISVERR